MTFGMRRTERGETFFNCLAVMVLVTGAVMWAWMKFGAHHDLVKPSFVPDRSNNREATLRYQQRMRERYFGSSDYAVSQAADFVNLVRKGKYASDRAAFEQRSSEVVRSLEDNLTELNANKVPVAFAEGHQLLGKAHSHAYEAVLLCGLARGDEPDLQKKRYREAGEMAAKAVREVHRARQEMQQRFR